MINGIGIAKHSREQVAHSLNILLADEHILSVKTRQAHWNVTGADFHAMHLFFEEQYRQLENIIDEVAERIRMLNHYPKATLRDFIKLSHFNEMRVGDNSSFSFISSLLEDHQAIILYLRRIIQEYDEKWRDAGSSDFTSGLLKEHEKMAWMLKAHLG